MSAVEGMKDTTQMGRDVRDVLNQVWQDARADDASAKETVWINADYGVVEYAEHNPARVQNNTLILADHGGTTGAEQIVRSGMYVRSNAKPGQVLPLIKWWYTHAGQVAHSVYQKFLSILRPFFMGGR